MAIGVLDAGTDFVENWNGQRFPYLGRIGSARMWEAYRVYRLVPDAWVISSEGIPAAWPKSAPAATPQHDALVHLDVPSSRVVIAPGALDTHEVT